ncbi:MAG: hypothetical protein LUH15_11855 [Tannerellaceae bacterium]|nr:hypothetical protein [Tannerellaceae bacterium]
MEKSRNKGRVFNDVPITFIVNLGARYLYKQEDTKDHETSLNLSFRLNYGNPYGDDFYSPYEWFQLKGGFDFFSDQPLITQANAIGVLWGKTVWSKDTRALTAGIFQHFDYYNSQIKGKDNEVVYPFRISQVAAVGGGALYNKVSEEDNVDVYAELYANGIILGASQTDHFFVDERDYNLGSGYSIKLFTGLTYKNTGVSC